LPGTFVEIHASVASPPLIRLRHLLPRGEGRS
jgi:hypothetical protein